MTSDRLSLSRCQSLDAIPKSVFQREVEVVGGGFLSGAAEGLHLSLTDLVDFSQRIRHSPLSTATKFAQDHWSEAAVAATIGYIAPKKYAGWLLLAASLRGILTSGAEAVVNAADTSIPTETARSNFAKQISSESRQFLNGLPVALAGGLAGSGMGSLVFGKGMGLYDFASGKVSSADVRLNLLKVADAFNPPKARLAVIDLDGTLVSTSKHLSLSIEQGIQQIAKATELSPELVSELMANQFSKLRSFTNPWTVELALAEKLKVGQPGGMSFTTFKQTVSDPYWKVFENNRADFLTTYEGVASTLPRLRAEGVEVMLFTNSPAGAAMPRIRSAGLESSFDVAIMIENATAPRGLASELVAQGSERLATWVGSPPESFVCINRSAAKPAPGILRDAINSRGLRPSQVMVIGDSIESDMALAGNTGARGLLAKWSAGDVVYDRSLNRVTGGNFPAAKPSSAQYEVELRAVPDILKHLAPPQRRVALLWSTVTLPSVLLPMQSYGLNGFRSARNPGEGNP